MTRDELRDAIADALTDYYKMSRDDIVDEIMELFDVFEDGRTAGVTDNLCQTEGDE